MPNQTKEQAIPKGRAPKKTNKGKFVFILVTLLALSGYFALGNQQYILSIFQHSDKTNPQEPEQSAQVLETTPQSNQEPAAQVSQDEELAEQKTLHENDSSTKPVIVRFGPDLVTYPTENLSPYDHYAEDQVEKESLIANLTHYRIYVANANELVVRFLMHENYREQLAKLKAAKLPDEITEIVKMMEEHLTFLDEDLTSKQIFPVNSKSLEKLIKVTKTNDFFQKRLELESKITEKLKILTSYIYSPDLQEQFLGTVLTQNPLSNNHD